MVGTLPVAKVWAGHPVGFQLLTTERFQYACYYDSSRTLVVAQRPLSSKTWKTTKLPTQVGWDSHNSIKIAVDKRGFIHISGNMHNVPLIYFRSTKPESIEAFAKLPMTGQHEERVTYPVFFKDAAGDLYFQYRSGGSGKGITFWNKYHADTQQWQGVFDTPFFDGEEEASAYMTNPALGPDGYFYIVWMWRATPTASTNHNLSCIRSKDLKRWENQRGDAMTLPIKWRDNRAVVDPVGPWNGLINMGYKVSWNSQKVPYISYHKYDARGISQVYLARWEGDQWKPYQLSRWEGFTWDLNRNGSLSNDVGISSVEAAGEGVLAVAYHHQQHGKGTWLVNENTMTIQEQLPEKVPAYLQQLTALPPREGMIEHRLPDNTGRYLLQWQTLPTNQDRPRPEPYPAPSELVLYELSK